MKLIFLCCALLGVQVISAQMSEIITIKTQNTSLVYSIDKQERLVFQYFGKRIDNTTSFTEREFLQVYNTNRTYSYEAYPGFGGGNIIEPAISIIHADGSLNTELRVTTTSNHKTGDVIQTIVKMKDAVYNLEVDLITDAHQTEDVITQRVIIRNNEKGSVELKNFYSSYLNFYSPEYYLTHFQGPWGNEMRVAEEKLVHGIKAIESIKGVRTSQSENPAFIISFNHPATENEGECIGGALAWSGNYKLSFQVDEWRRLNVLSGINPFMSGYHLEQGEEFETPSHVFTFSSSGIGQLSRNLHDWARRYLLPDGNSRRPIVLNSWEGAYFDFDESVLTGMINKASPFGIEMFVLDDGWFGNGFPRNNSTAGLGDWQTNTAKLPRGLNYLVDYARNKGLKFGLWIEPEMVNPNSNLALSNPGWIVQSPGREIPALRNQWMLDLSNPDVRNFIWDTIDSILTACPGIAYIKWDANKHVENVGSTYLPSNLQSHFWIEYTRGLYMVYEKIRQKYPDVILQACSSGGGRVDFGSMKYNHEFWPSDNTNPLSRIFIQYGTNLIYPPVATASHVSPSPNHQTGIVTPLKFRFDVAMTGRLGMEMHPGELNGADSIFAVKAIESYKKFSPLIAGGDLYRLISPYEKGGWASLMYVSKDKKEAVLFVFSTESHPRAVRPSVRLNGLSPESSYKITEINQQGARRFWGNEKAFSGDFLMNAGIDISVSKQFESAVFLIQKTDSFTN